MRTTKVTALISLKENIYPGFQILPVVQAGTRTNNDHLLRDTVVFIHNLQIVLYGCHFKHDYFKNVLALCKIT